MSASVLFKYLYWGSQAYIKGVGMSIFKRGKKKERKSYKNPLQVIAVGFSILILGGAFLLMLPISTKSGESAPFLTALFTATTSTCVTGLVVVDTYTYWSNFGHLVIITMIQIGGMGFMLVLTAFSILIGRRITIRERLLISKSISVDNMAGIVKLSKRIILGTFVIESLGAVILSIRLIKDFGVAEGIRKGIFHSISSFCNAGIDLFGQIEPFTSVTTYKGDFVITFTISFLIILGGLGFYLWDDVLSTRTGNRLNLHTKIVLTTTAILLLGGTAFFMIAEWSNPLTLGGESFIDKFMLAFFQSTTTRTAGYNQLDQAALTPASKAFSMMLMFIGGSPGSTAGGIKTVTFALLGLTAVSTLRGKASVTVYKRTIPNRFIMDAITIVLVAVFCVLSGTFMLSMIDGISFESALFECISAFATVGLTEGITPTLSPIAQLVLIGLMYMGRVGIITLGLAILVRSKKESRIKYPEGKIIVG